MPASKDVSVTLRIDGVDQEEYGSSTSTDGSVQCHVASQEGKEFSLRVVNNLPDMRLFCKVFVDGVLMHKLGCAPQKRAYSRGADTGSGYLPYYFKKLQVTDNDDLVTLAGQNWDAIGVVEIRFFRAQLSSTPLPPKTRTLNVDDGPIHELSKKAGAHRVGLGQEVRHPRHKGRFHDKLVDTKASPYAVIRFLYKPIEILQAQGITTSIPKAGESSKRKHDSASNERRQRAKVASSSSAVEDVKPVVLPQEDAELASMEEQLNQLQQAIAMKKASQASAVKREVSPIRVLNGNSHGPIVIDLTED